MDKLEVKHIAVGIYLWLALGLIAYLLTAWTPVILIGCIPGLFVFSKTYWEYTGEQVERLEALLADRVKK